MGLEEFISITFLGVLNNSFQLFGKSFIYMFIYQFIYLLIFMEFQGLRVFLCLVSRELRSSYVYIYIIFV